MIKAVIFDMDGVLIDSEPLNDRHLQSLVKKLGFELSEDYLEQLRGLTGRSMWRKMKDDYNLKQTLDELVVSESTSFFNFLDSLPNLEPVKGVRELIQKLQKDKLKLALASSASPRRINLILTKFHMTHVFPVIVTGKDVTHGKPHPEVFSKTAKLLKLPPESCIVIEDAENGVKAAKLAGMKVVGFAGFPHNKQDLSQADKIIHSFDELQSDIIQSL